MHSNGFNITLQLFWRDCITLVFGMDTTKSRVTNNYVNKRSKRLASMIQIATHNGTKQCKKKRKYNSLEGFYRYFWHEITGIIKRKVIASKFNLLNGCVTYITLNQRRMVHIFYLNCIFNIYQWYFFHKEVVPCFPKIILIGVILLLYKMWNM